MKLVIKWREFENQLKEFIKEADRLLDLKDGADNTYDVQTFLMISENWVKNCHTFLKHSFNTISNEYARSFITAEPYNSYLKRKNKGLMSIVDDVFEDLRTKRNSLDYTLRILSVSDIVIEPKLVDKRIRALYTNYEITDLVLDKLYYLYDNYYYPLRAILRGNGIILTNGKTFEKIVDKLEKKGYIKTIRNRTVSAQLTLKGRGYIEEKRQFKLIDKFYFVKKTSGSITGRADIKVNRTELGKAKLVRELNDMKSLYHKLNKKNWSTLLRGKLNDLESIKVINKETLNIINQSIIKDDTDFL